MKVLKPHKLLPVNSQKIVMKDTKEVRHVLKSYEYYNNDGNFIGLEMVKWHKWGNCKYCREKQITNT